jgi:hypothetical protein
MSIAGRGLCNDTNCTALTVRPFNTEAPFLKAKAEWLEVMVKARLAREHALELYGEIGELIKELSDFIETADLKPEHLSPKGGRGKQSSRDLRRDIGMAIISERTRIISTQYTRNSSRLGNVSGQISAYALSSKQTLLFSGFINNTPQFFRGDF